MPVAPPTTAHSYAYQSLRTQILNGDLAPGAPLIQATLARQLGVSMTPIREALRDLATEGLVTLSPHRGATVTVLDLADAQEIHRIRLALEPQACAVACELVTVEMLERAEEIFGALSTASTGAWVALNRDFHVHLISANPSPRLRGILSSLLDAATLYVGVAMTHRRGPSPQEEHRQILDAFHRRDPQAVAAAVANHIQSSIASLERQGSTGEG